MLNVPSGSNYNPALGVPGLHPVLNERNVCQSQIFTQPYGTVNGHNGHNGNTSGYRGETNSMESSGDLASMIIQMNNNFSRRLSTIENSLSKLGTIENDVTMVRADVSKIKSDNIEFNRRLIEVEVSCQSNSDSFDNLIKSTDNNQQKISKLQQENNYLNSQLQEAKHSFSNLKEDFLELQSRSMQENLLFFGINEAELTNSHPEDTSGERDQPAENTENILRDFLVHVLKIDRQTEGQIKFDRVHRLGKRKRQRNNPRPIVAKFENYTDRETVRKAGMDLNSNPDSKMKVREQFPREIEERRKTLYPVMYRMKNQNPNTRVNLVRDKLYVNGNLYIPENDPEYKLPRADTNQRQFRGQTQFQPPYQSSMQFRPPPPPPRFSNPRHLNNYNEASAYQYQGAIPKQYNTPKNNTMDSRPHQRTPWDISNRFSLLESNEELSERMPDKNTRQFPPLVIKIHRKNRTT